MSTTDTKKEWTPPKKIEDLYEKVLAGNKFAGTNSPTAGARTTKALDVGKAPYQLYSLGTPNGQKVGIMLEELKVEYDEHTISISGDQFTSGFVEINLNSKIPAMVDQSDPENKINLFESGGILLYLADKHQQFVPPLSQPKDRAEVINWLMWQMGSAPYFGQFGHFLNYAPADKIEARDYGVARYGMETQRCFSVLDKQLEKNKDLGGYISTWGYSIADIAIYPWVRGVSVFYKADELLSLSQYKYLNLWLKKVGDRPAVQKGLNVTPFSAIKK